MTRRTTDLKRELERIASEHADRLRRRAYSWLHDWTKADDVLQDAALRFLLHGHRLRDRRKAASYFTSIVINLCRHYWRDDRGDEPLKDTHAVKELDTSLMAETAETGRQLRDAIVGLTHIQRATLTLFSIDGLSANETALALGVRPGAVRALCHRARLAIAGRLGKRTA